MWRGFCHGAAEAEFSLEKAGAFTGNQSQRISFKSGTGEVGIENQSLNRWGMNIAGGKRYEGYVWVRAEARTDLFLILENSDGTTCYTQTRVTVAPGGWQRKEFTLKPVGSDTAGRFAIKLKRPGSVCLGHAFLQPGNWGRFKGLPVRRDVAEALVAQGLAMLRYGGSMINAPEYRWKKMIGPPERRPPYKGTWYPYSSNGWGIFDFLNFCEAAGFLGIPAVNMDESPSDMADFIEYVNGARDSVWGRRRAADGHPAPYHLKYLELGNEEAVNEAYWQKFKPLAETIWSRDPKIVLVVGDFAYDRAIQDPFNFDGAPLIRSLAAHKKILDLAQEHDREVWFDVHIGTEGPPAPGNLPGVRSFIEQLNKLSPGANHKVAIFEFNAGNHSLKRALANAWALNQLAPLGNSLPIACSANCLQPDGQNDNGWDQGLLFLTPSTVWPQPPYFVTQMVARSFLPLTLKTELEPARGSFDVSARKSEDGTMLILQVVNTSGESVPAEIRLQGFRPRAKFAQASVLAGNLDAANTAQNPRSVCPSEREWAHGLGAGAARFTFAPCSFTVLRFR
jgi:hypothetical protein